MKNKETLTDEITSYVKAELKDHEDATPWNLFVQADSLRLRSRGYHCLKSLFDHETFEHERNFHGSEILFLCDRLNSPFYIYRKKLVLFDGKSIIQCKTAGSISAWIRLFS